MNGFDESGSVLNLLAASAFQYLIDAGYKVSSVNEATVDLLFGHAGVRIAMDFRAFELDVGVLVNDDYYSLREILSADGLDPDDVKLKACHSWDEVREALGIAAPLLLSRGARLLRGDPTFVDLLNLRRRQWARNFELEQLARRLRPKAEEAFRRGAYSEAAEFYGQMKDMLTPSELKKLEIAVKRSS